MAKIKCAVYVRKSTEYGLEQEFNSLHNQEEACRAYISSQSFNGWEFAKTYSDGGISGGTMERPGLRAMLDDMAHGLVDVVVVYKLDRLSRSIMDFHKMMQTFDKYNCSFVSITQSFDTATSMGKLTLNMLLSFAQFEREVSSERVRDKIRASRAKGIWTGGIPWLGYDTVNKKLAVNPREAETVKLIFEKYLEIGSVTDLARYLKQCGITNKNWTTQGGKVRGGNAISANTLHKMLREKIYTGYIEHKKTKAIARGEHDAIISQELFDAVQEKLKYNTNGKHGRDAGSPNLLSGKVYNSNGVLFTNQRTCGRGKTDKLYYATKGYYIPSATVDKLATDTVTEFMNSDMVRLPDAATTILKQINIPELSYVDRRRFIQTIIEKIIIADNQMIMFIKPDASMLKQFSTNTINQFAKPMDYVINDNAVIIKKDAVFRKGAQDGKTGMISISENNHLIIRAFALAWKYKEIYERTGNLHEIMKSEKTSWRSLYRYLNLAYLSPKIVNDVMSGKLNCSVDDLFKMSAEHVGITNRLV